MAEYIDKTQAIIEMIDNNVDHAQGTDGREVIQILSDVPAADVAPMVRCAECRYRVDPDKCCHPDGLLRSKDSDFCSYGERKE